MASEIEKLGDLRKEIRNARNAQRENLGRLLSNDSVSVAKLLNNEPAALAQLLALAAQDLVGKAMTAEEKGDFAAAFSRHPALMARLLSGMGA